jgi:hypothetical protein
MRVAWALFVIAALGVEAEASAQPRDARVPRPRYAPTMPVASPMSRPAVLAAIDESLPPWTEAGDVPVPEWARSVAPTKSDAAFYVEPGRLDARRGSAQLGARLPLYATRRESGCQGRWLLVGPFAWICSDVAEYTADALESPPLGVRPWIVSGIDMLRAPRAATRPLPPIEPPTPSDDGLPYRYYFAGRDGAYGFTSLARAQDDAPDQELEAGFAVAIVEEQQAHGEAWGRTTKGRWIAMRELFPARSSAFHGFLVVDGKLDIAWVVNERAPFFASDKADKPLGTRARFEKLRVRGVKGEGTAGAMVEVESDSGGPVWMRGKDLGRAIAMPPPPEAGGEGASERWIDVSLAQQTLVAYEGSKPVFATLVSTGKGPAGSELATRTGTHRIWVKIFTTKMDNLEKDEVDRHYAIEDVPWVQFFDKAIALHGAFWHRDFGHIHSHGCVNLAPLDARWLFAFTSPHLPAGWTAVLPTRSEPGVLVRVR